MVVAKAVLREALVELQRAVPGKVRDQISSSSTAATSGTTGASAEEKPARRPRKKGEKGGGKDRGPKDAVRKSEEEPASEEAARVSTSASGGAGVAELFGKWGQGSCGFRRHDFYENGMWK